MYPLGGHYSGDRTRRQQHSIETEWGRGRNVKQSILSGYAVSSGCSGREEGGAASSTAVVSYRAGLTGRKSRMKESDMRCLCRAVEAERDTRGSRRMVVQ